MALEYAKAIEIRVNPTYTSRAGVSLRLAAWEHYDGLWTPSPPTQ